MHAADMFFVIKELQKSECEPKSTGCQRKRNKNNVLATIWPACTRPLSPGLRLLTSGKQWLAGWLKQLQRAFLTFGCSSLRQIAEALAKRWQRPCALAQHLLLGALQGGAVVESLFALEEILEGRYQARTVLQHVANLEMLGESEGFQSGAVQCCPKMRFSWKADASSPDGAL